MVVVVGGLSAALTLRAMPAGTYVPGRASQTGQAVKREARLRETTWSSKNGGFADGLVTLPRKIKVLISKVAQSWTLTDQMTIRLLERALNYKPRERRERGRPRKRWQRVDTGTGQAT